MSPSGGTDWVPLLVAVLPSLITVVGAAWIIFTRIDSTAERVRADFARILAAAKSDHDRDVADLREMLATHDRKFEQFRSDVLSVQRNSITRRDHADLVTKVDGLVSTANKLAVDIAAITSDRGRRS